MDHHEHMNLLRGGITSGVWADFGSGRGAFTLALADLMGSTGEIYSVDTDVNALKVQEREMKRHFPLAFVHYQQADFTRQLDLPPLDGIVMANSLHFHRHKEPILKLMQGYLKPSGRFVLVEYNTDRGNNWVPYPLSYPSWHDLSLKNGFTQTRLLSSRGSSFLNEIYSAQSEGK